MRPYIEINIRGATFSSICRIAAFLELLAEFGLYDIHVYYEAIFGVYENQLYRMLPCLFFDRAEL